jgi:MFS family permease
MRWLVLPAVVGLVLSAVVAPIAAEPDPDRNRPSLLSIAAATVDRPGRRAYTGAVALSGIAISTLLVYQVPLMVSAGLPLTTAATMAGVRGFAQLGGRLPLTPLLRLVGSRVALMLAFGAIALSTGILTVAGSVPIALLFAITAGFGIGAYSPLHGIYAQELFDRRTLGATMGLYGSVMMLSGAVGPVAAGWLAEATGERRWTALLMATTAVGAIALMSRTPRVISRTPSRPARSAGDAAS